MIIYWNLIFYKYDLNNIEKSIKGKFFIIQTLSKFDIQIFKCRKKRLAKLKYYLEK